MICGECQEEVRFGHRDGSPGWWHRLEADHDGRPVCPPEYDPPPVIPEPEVPMHDVDPTSFPPRSGIRQIINLVAKTPGWTLYRLTACRGPYVGSKGEVLSISDSLVLGAREDPALDGSVRFAVGSWRDGAFDGAYTGYLRGGVVHPVPANSAEMKTWIKGIPSDAPDDDAGLPAALQKRES